MSTSTARVILGKDLIIATCGSQTHRGITYDQMPKTQDHERPHSVDTIHVLIIYTKDVM